MHFLTSLIIVFGFAFVVCVGVVKMVWDLCQLSFHEPPANPEAPSNPADVEELPAKATDPHELRPAEMRDTP
jgi:hypothetical protein